jgi:protein-disulfide isomerase
MATKNQRKGISWELVGIVAILAVLVVGGLFIVFDSTVGPGQAGWVVPTILARDPAMGMDQPEFSGVDADGRPFLGKADAPAVFYEFADFQCPHCREYSLFQGKAIEKDLLATGKAKLVWVGFPFMDDGSGEQESVNAQMAGQCGAQQGKFWEVHDWLFTNQSTIANQGHFNKDQLAIVAEKAGLDTALFATCMEDPKTAEFVQKDKDFAIEKSVNSTPSFYLAATEKLYEGAGPQELQDLRAALEAQVETGN